MKTRSSVAPSSQAARFIIYVAFVLTTGMGLFPPYVSLNGTEYAFVFTGPEWSRRMAAISRDLGLAPRLQWELLLIQLAAMWAIALGARWFLVSPSAKVVVLLFALLPLLPCATARPSDAGDAPTAVCDAAGLITDPSVLSLRLPAFLFNPAAPCPDHIT